MKRVAKYVYEILKMSVDVWERSEIAGTLIAAVGALVVALLGAWGISIKLAFDAGHYWQWALGLWFVVLFVFVTPFRLWHAEKTKLEAFEEAARPKVEISDPIEITDPKGAHGKAFRTWRLKLTNVSMVVVKNCYAKQKSFINKRGDESANVGIRFKMSTDQPKYLASYEYRQSFDLAPGAHEYVDIACMNEIDGAIPMVFMLYAIPGAGEGVVKNAIPQEFFPHRLIVEVCAEDIVKPIERNYVLHISNAGLLKMDTDSDAKRSKGSETIF